MKKEKKENSIEEQLKQLSEALKLLEGQLSQPLTKKEKVKNFLLHFIPMSKYNNVIIQKQFQQLSYSILIVQKSFLNFVNELEKSRKKIKDKKYEEGWGQYQ